MANARDISFSSFNLYNLQLPGRAIYRDRDGWPQEVYDRKIAFSAQMLARLEADVTGFQELWAPEALDQALDAAGMGESHVALTPPDHPGDRIVCAAAVRREMLRGTPEWITDFPPELVLRSTGDDQQQPDIDVDLHSFSRPVLYFRVQPAPRAPEIHVFVCHFKSRRPHEVWRERSWYDPEIHGPHHTAIGYALSTIRRTAEAAALRVLITRIAKNSEDPVVVIGDMNDGKASNTLNNLTEQPRFLAPLSSGGRDNALYTAQVLQEYRSVRDVYYTHIYQGQRDSLDHILVSEQFYDNSRKRKWRFHDMVVVNDHLDFEHKRAGTSDHGILRAQFRWSPAQAG